MAIHAGAGQEGRTIMNSNTGSAPEKYIFGGYEILETTGAGGMGIVYRALDLALNREVALKILRDDLREKRHIVARFKREAEAFAKLQHPNIVRIYSVGSYAKIPYFAMELVEGASLSTILKNGGPMPWEKALRIGRQVADALRCAHGCGIIHRDIKPGNILIDKSGKAWVTDFGIAKVLSAEVQLTVDGDRIGTPQYMSPERCLGSDITPQSDIYSLGVLLFQTISGRLPFEAASSSSLIQKIAHGEPARLRQFAPDIPDHVDRLIAWMLERKPENRPKDAGLLKTAIERVIQGKPIDEHVGELASALAMYRKNLPNATPTPHGKSAKKKPAARRRRSRAKSGLKAPATRPRLLPAVALLLFMATAGALALVWLPLSKEAPVLPLAQEPDYGLARWTDAAPLAAVAQENGGSRIRLQLPGFSASAMAPLQEDRAIVVQLDGMGGTPRAGQRVLCRVTPETASILAPPMSIRHGGNYHLLESAAHSSGAPGFFLGTPGSTIYTRGPYTENPWLVADAEAELLRIHPDGNRVLLACRDNLGDVSLITACRDSVLRRITLLPPGGAIRQAAWSPDGETVAALRETGEGRVKLMILKPGPGQAIETRLLHEGNLEMSRQPFRADGAMIAVSETGPDSGALLLLPADGGPLFARLDPARGAHWHPEKPWLIASAPGLSRTPQLHAIEAAPPWQRIQLTMIPEGIQPEIILSADGTRAWAAVKDQPELAAIDLNAALR
jgi:serine/threonine protein kinase